MSSEIIQSVTSDNYDDLTSYFHKFSFHYFEDYLMIETNLRVR
jgi:hypothetical protein